MSLINQQIDLIEAERRADRWEAAAQELLSFVNKHVRIVGYEEIEGWKRAKKAFEHAEKLKPIVTQYKNKRWSQENERRL